MTKKTKKTVRKARIAPPRTARQMLNEIDSFLARDNLESGKLWDVLTALRGPDDGVESYKTLATIPIRRAAFPKVVKKHGAYPDNISATFGYCDRGFTKTNSQHEHFDKHASKAAIALGLIN